VPKEATGNGQRTTEIAEDFPMRIDRPNVAAILLVTAGLCLASTAAEPRPLATLSVQVDQPGIQVSPRLYGIFFEEIIPRAGSSVTKWSR
jgi:hypothetical protein